MTVSAGTPTKVDLQDGTRSGILNATQELMLNEGYAAVTTRRIAKMLGLTSAAVHYHFKTTDDLFIALHERMTRQKLALLETVRDAPDPLRALWDMQTRWHGSALGVEFMALANHRKSIQPVLARTSSEARDRQAELLAPLLARSRLDPIVCPPVCLSLLLNGVSHALINEAMVGITRGHSELHAFADVILAAISRPEASLD